MDEDAEAVFEKIHEDFEGELPFDDKADPEKIREVFGLSKAAFKRAVGRLYRERKIRFEDGKIIEC
jgi:predicted RNA-binding protein (virulence factor B family)